LHRVSPADPRLKVSRVLATASPFDVYIDDDWAALAPGTFSTSVSPPTRSNSGFGIHGEPGVRRGPLESADALVDRLLDAILAELSKGNDKRESHACPAT